MKKHLLPTLIILLLFGISGYWVSDYFLKQVNERMILQYRILAILNKIQELRYHATSIHEEFLSLRYRGTEMESILARVEHAQMEVRTINVLLVDLSDHDEILKRYALRVEPLEKGIKTLSEHARKVLSAKDLNDRSQYLEEAIAYGEQIENVIESMEVRMDDEAKIMSEGMTTLQTDIRRYRTIFLTAEFAILLFFAVTFIRYTRNHLRQTLRMIQEIPGGKGREILESAMEDKDLSAIASELSTLMTNIEKNEKKLGEMTIVDPLTGLYNRRYFQERLNAEFKRFVRYNTLFSIAIIDVDHFKGINDSYGHQQGDEVLKEIAKTLRAKTRETDIVARYGGEEFVILYTCTEKGGSFLHIDRIRASIAEQSFPGLPRKVTISAGISDATGKTSTDEVIGEADAALYQAKNSGRNRCEIYYSPLSAGSVGHGANEKR